MMAEGEGGKVDTIVSKSGWGWKFVSEGKYDMDVGGGGGGKVGGGVGGEVWLAGADSIRGSICRITCGVGDCDKWRGLMQSEGMGVVELSILEVMVTSSGRSQTTSLLWSKDSGL